MSRVALIVEESGRTVAVEGIAHVTFERTHEYDDVRSGDSVMPWRVPIDARARAEIEFVGEYGMRDLPRFPDLARRATTTNPARADYVGTQRADSVTGFSSGGRWPARDAPSDLAVTDLPRFTGFSP